MSDAANCVAEWCADDDWCPVTCAAHVLARKWHPVIVHRLLERGPLRFNELAAAIDDVSNTVLTESLDDLERHGVVDRRIVNEKPVHVAYTLTDRGEALHPVIDALRQWGETHLLSDTK